MKKLNYLFLLLLFPLIYSCGFDDSPPALPNTVNSMDLVFKVQYDGLPVVTFGEIYTHDAGFDIVFTRFSFFLSDLTLINNTGEEEVLDIFHVRTADDHSTPEGAQEGTTVSIDSIPDGSYNSIRFGIGVPPDMNAKLPSDYPNGHPLFFTGEHWAGWSSYIFHKTEGQIDLDGDGTFETGMALHVGSDTTFRQKEITAPLVFENGNTNELIITIDLKEYLMPTGKAAYDLEGTPQIHSLSQMNQAIELSDNLVDAMQ